MSPQKVPASDPARSLALLWGSHTKPGRSGLTVRAITEAALGLADAEGLDAVSMRRVAEKLGVGTMSLYTHVPAKGELIDLMIDAVEGEIYTGVDDLDRHENWRAAVTDIAQRDWDLYQRHPWLLHIVSTRPVIGPNTSLRYETELRPLDGIGLSDLEMDSVLALVHTHVAGTARLQVNTATTTATTGTSEADWWESVVPTLDRVMAGMHLPLSARVGQAAGEAYNAASSPTHTFTFGLERILDGVEQLIDRSSRSGGTSEIS